MDQHEIERYVKGEIYAYCGHGANDLWCKDFGGFAG
jgi:hypothetical protein